MNINTDDEIILAYHMVVNEQDMNKKHYQNFSSIQYEYMINSI